ncbi:MAG: hypothetical protein HZB79_07500 [Deltaproteobacteria bacterium]|nr:hypothetical protein [Deltaproteobacteria bacterium]
MKDTHPEIEERFFKMIMEKSGEERLKMGFEMNMMARKLATASILQNAPQISEEDIKLAIFDRFYGIDLSSKVRQKVIEKIKR